MLKRLHLPGVSGLTICMAACGFPRPPDITPDTGTTQPGSQFPASNSVTRADLAAGIAPLVVPAGATYVLDTDHGSMFDAKNGNAPIRVAGPGVQDGVFYRSDDQNRALFAVQSLMLGEGAILRGVGTRALILVADGAVEIHGILDVSAGHCSNTTDGAGCPGPGGSAAAAGCSPGKIGGFSTGAAGGGGGGGFASPGGSGGAGGAHGVLGGEGGSAMQCLGPTLDPIHGGSGGAGGDRPGNAGGGALQVTSYTSIVLVTPKIATTTGAWAGGAGGSGGAPGGSGPFAGGGGGAGGAIMFEAPMIDIRSGVVLAANGGGGGAGAVGIDGQPGQFSGTAASGGFAGSSLANGGAGAALNVNATDGAPGVMTQQSSPAGGGGGGGIGRIRINAIMLKVSDEAVFSPAPSVNLLPAS